jgi:hypothetical protein
LSPVEEGELELAEVALVEVVLVDVVLVGSVLSTLTEVSLPSDVGESVLVGTASLGPSTPASVARCLTAVTLVSSSVVTLLKKSAMACECVQNCWCLGVFDFLCWNMNVCCLFVLGGKETKSRQITHPSRSAATRRTENAQPSSPQPQCAREA